MIMLEKYKEKGEKMENEYMENINLLILLLILLMPLLIKFIVGYELKKQPKNETHNNDDEYIEIIESAKIELINLQHTEVDIEEIIEENIRVMSRTKEYLKDNRNLMRELEKYQIRDVAKQQEETQIPKRATNFKEME